MRIMIYGAGGAMGKMLGACIRNSDDKILCGVDKFASQNDFDFPIYKDCSDIKEMPDCIIDFSVRAGIYDFLPFAVKNNIPCVVATTGHNEEEMAYIKEAAKSIPVFKTGNMSLGISLLLQLAKMGAKILGRSADIEIIEQHHNKKVDAPSGTALLLADGIKSVIPEANYIFGREGAVGKRTQNEIGIHAVRGGTIVGKHEVMFIMDKEVITLKHEAESKTVFANGSINAAHYIIKQTAGIFSMEDMLKNIIF